MKYLRIPVFILLALLSAYEEVMQLIQRGSWHEGMTWLPIWETDWNSFWKLFDTHHLVFGLFVLAFTVAIRIKPKNLFYWKNELITDLAHIGIYWWAFFWIRNIGMHILFMNYEYIRWKYLLPITF